MKPDPVKTAYVVEEDEGVRALLERVPGREALDALQTARRAQATVPKPFRIPAPIGAIEEDDLPTCS